MKFISFRPTEMRRQEELTLKNKRMSEEAVKMKSRAAIMVESAEKMKEKAVKMKEDMKANQQGRHEVQAMVMEKEEDADDKRKEQDAATYSSMARRQYQNRVSRFSQKDHKCLRCWLIKECCICDKITPVSTKHECILLVFLSPLIL